MIRNFEPQDQTGEAEDPAPRAGSGEALVGDVPTRSEAADRVALNRMQRRRAARGIDPDPKPQKWFHPHKK